MRVDVMVDIETLGKKSDSTIIQIAAVAFDILTGKHIDTFNMVADISKNENQINVCGDTIQWWLQTNKELFAELLNGGEFSSEEVLRAFSSWLNCLSEDTKNLHLWGNGILFDNKMIQHQFELIGLEYPIYYRNDRDVRTIVDLASQKLGISENELKEKYKDKTLVEHDAINDVVNQINLVVNCYRELISHTEQNSSNKDKK